MGESCLCIGFDSSSLILFNNKLRLRVVDISLFEFRKHLILDAKSNILFLS